MNDSTHGDENDDIGNRSRTDWNGICDSPVESVVQVTTDSTGRPIVPVGPEILAKSEQLVAIQAIGEPAGELEFKAFTRLIDKIDPSYKD